jgi:hypothetical protein
MAIEVKAPGDFSYHAKEARSIIFLGGVIDMGIAPDWQKAIVEALKPYHDVLILNPRRTSWDSSWEQSIDNGLFKEQVLWELDGQEAASINIYVFAPDETSALSSKAPITLMELGLFVDSADTYIVCPPGYYRKGNVDIVAERYHVPVYNNLDELICVLHDRLLEEAC